MGIPLEDIDVSDDDLFEKSNDLYKTVHKEITKERIFLRALEKFPSVPPSQIVRIIFNCKDQGVAATISSNLLVKYKKDINEMMNRLGVTDERLTFKLTEALEAKRRFTSMSKSGEIVEEVVPDYNSQLKALEIALKLKGYLKPRSGQEDDSAIPKSGNLQVMLIHQEIYKDSNGERKTINLDNQETGTPGQRADLQEQAVSLLKERS